jgi:hypothetical protein
MTDDTKIKDAMDLLIESGQLQMTMATEALGLAKAFAVEGQPMLDPKIAEDVVRIAFLNAFSDSNINKIQNSRKVNEGKPFTYPSLADAVSPNVASLRAHRAGEKREQNKEMVELLKAPTQKPSV